MSTAGTEFLCRKHTKDVGEALPASSDVGLGSLPDKPPLSANLSTNQFHLSNNELIYEDLNYVKNPGLLPDTQTSPLQRPPSPWPPQHPWPGQDLAFSDQSHICTFEWLQLIV